MELSCMEWNINGRGGAYGIAFPCFIAKKIEDKKPDIVILVEFTKRNEWEERFCNKLSKEYTICISKDYGNGKNQVLIAIKRSLNPIIDGVRSYIPHGKCLLDNPDSEYLHPEYLQVDLTIGYEKDRKPLSIIGVRIKTEGKNQDYNNRMQQFILLKTHLDSLSNPVLVAGDFNNGFIRNEYSKPEAKKYNYQLMKGRLSKKHRLETPDKEWSWKITMNESTGEYSCGKMREDHMIVSPELMRINLDYYCDFASIENGYTVANYLRGKNGIKSFISGLPDHAYLYGSFKIN